MNFLRRMERSDEVDDSFKKLIRKKVGGPRGKNFGRRENITKQKTRKELRKEMRKNKKSAKHTYILNKLGKLTQETETTGKDKKKKRKRKRKNPYQKDEEENVLDLTPLPKKKSGVEDSSSGDRVERNSRGVVDEEMEQLKREMEESRKTRLLEENAHEDKFIRRMEKKLKLNKKAKIPASFKTDGLDYLLEICDNMSSKKKKEMKKGKEDQDDSEDDDDEDAEHSDDFDDADMEAIPEDSEDGSEEELSGEENDDEEMSGDSDDDENVQDINMSDNGEGSIDSGGSIAEGESDLSEDEVKKKTKKQKAKEKAKTTKDDGIWEDIYGKLRRKDGSYVDEKEIEELPEKKNKLDAISEKATTGKYVPPMKRQNQSQKEKISRSLKGLLNRLSEGNMHSISTQVEELYMTNSRNEMNECMLELLYAVLLSKVTMPERVILEHVMLIGILHANIGTEIGAFFLQSFVTDFREKYETVVSLDDNRELENLVQLISAMYQFKIIDACLVYDILNFMALNFTSKDVELILTCLRSVGFKLRKDDPIGLKSLIIVIQDKATKSKSEGSSAKVKFMLEIVMAIRNNNMSKIPNYDPSIASHLQKLIKTHIHKGNYISVMKIKMDDLLNAKTKGRWWIVGSAWTNTSSSHQDEPGESKQIVTSKDSKMNEKLLKKARALGMNTETRKNVFSILMTAEDYMDAFEKLNHLDLKNNQERELIHVTTYCCLHEKKFNPYYGYIVSKFCSMERKFMLTLQYNLWDRLKDLPSLKSFQLKNLAKLLVHLINDKSLPLSTLKVIEYAEMDKIKLKFLNDVLTGILMQKHEENIQEIFLKVAMSEKLSVFRESLRLFLCHFMVQKSIETSDGETITNDLSEDQMQLLNERIKVAETTLLVGKGRVLL